MTIAFREWPKAQDHHRQQQKHSVANFLPCHDSNILHGTSLWSQALRWSAQALPLPPIAHPFPSNSSLLCFSFLRLWMPKCQIGRKAMRGMEWNGQKRVMRQSAMNRRWLLDAADRNARAEYKMSVTPNHQWTTGRTLRGKAHGTPVIGRQLQPAMTTAWICHRICEEANEVPRISVCKKEKE